MRIGAATTNGTICLADDVDPSEVIGEGLRSFNYHHY